MIRVAHICTKFNRLSETFLYDLLVGLEHAGVENHVLAAVRVNAAERPFPRVRILRIPFWRQAVFAISRYGLGFYNLPFPRRASRQALREIRPHVILAHFGGTGAAMAPVAKEAGIPMMVVFHAFDLFRRDFRPATYRALWDSHAQAVAVSEHGKRRLLELGCPAQRARVIHCGVDMTRFALRERRRRTGDALLFLGLGRLVEKKGFDDLLLAVAAIRRRRALSFRLDLWGDGPQKRRLGRLTDRLGLRDVVTFRGAANARDVPEILAAYDAFVLPSKTARDGDTEGIPIAILEAQAAGLPVVATRHAGIPEAVPPANREFLAREGDAGDLARKLLALAAYRDRYREIGLRGREWVARAFSLTDEIHAYRRLCEEIAAGAGLRAAGGT